MPVRKKACARRTGAPLERYMEKGCYVKDIAPASEARGIFVVTQAAQGQSRNGPYWRLTLADASGSVESKIWHPLSAEFTEIAAGSLVWAEGRAGLYRDQVQLTVEQMRFLNEEECASVDHAALMPASPYPLDEMLDELQDLIKKEFVHAPWRKFVQGFFNNEEMRSAFRVCPAAKGVHHAYVGGLLEHTLNVTKLCDFYTKAYPALNRDLLLTAAIFHDIGKTKELSLFPQNDYTNDGQLLGHIMIGAEMVHDAAQKIDGFPQELENQLKHCILAHHGELEYGSPKKPAMVEAVALNLADNADAKMETLTELFDAAPAGNEWLGYNRFFESNIRRTGDFS